MSMSHYAYNETVAHSFLPLSEQQARTQGLQRSDMSYQTNIPTGIQPRYVKDISAQDMYSDDILGQIFLCEISNKPYNIITSELAFYKKHNLSLPRIHPHVRQQQRLIERNKQFITLS